MFWLRAVSPYSLALLLHFFVHSHESLLGRKVSKTCYFIKVSVSSLMRHSLLFLFLLHFHFGIEFFYTGPLWPAGDTSKMLILGDNSTFTLRVFRCPKILRVLQ